MLAAYSRCFDRAQTRCRAARFNNTFLVAVFTFTTQTVVVLRPAFSVFVNHIAAHTLVSAYWTALRVQLLFNLAIGFFGTFTFATLYGSHITNALRALVLLPLRLVFIKRSIVIARIIARIFGSFTKFCLPSEYARFFPSEFTPLTANINIAAVVRRAIALTYDQWLEVGPHYLTMVNVEHLLTWIAFTFVQAIAAIVLVGWGQLQGAINWTSSIGFIIRKGSIGTSFNWTFKRFSFIEK